MKKIIAVCIIFGTPIIMVRYYSEKTAKELILSLFLALFIGIVLIIILALLGDGLD